jgi:hypothetical protein
MNPSVPRRHRHFSRLVIDRWESGRWHENVACTWLRDRATVNDHRYPEPATNLIYSLKWCSSSFIRSRLRNSTASAKS